MKKIRTHQLLALVIFGAMVAGFAGSSMAARTSPPAGTNVTPSSAYVAPTAAATKLGEANIARFEELVKYGLNAGQLSIIDKLVSPTVIDHQFYGPGYPRGREGIKALTAALRTAFPDLHATTPVLVASNNGTQTFAIVRTTGTNTGKYLGVPPTGKKVVINIMESALWKDGVIVEHWGVSDNLGLLAQMGFIPVDKFPSYSTKVLAKQFQQELANPPAPHPYTALTPQAKLATATRLVNAVSNGNLFATADITAPNYVDYEYYGQGYPTKPPIATARAAVAVNKTAIPNLHTTIKELQVIGPQVFGIAHSTGTNDGPFLGAPATGRKIAIDLFEYWHFNSKGQIDMHNGIADLLGLISQLGYVPPNSVPLYSMSKVDPQFVPELKKG